MKYWVVIDNKRRGPLDFEDLKHISIKPDSLVWREGLEDWMKAEDLSELKFLFTDIQPASETETEEEVKAETENEPIAETKAEEPKAVQPEPAAQANFSLNNFNTNQMPPKPKTYLGFAIAATILFSLIIGAISIIFATLVNSKYNKGEYDKAQKYSRLALYFAIGAVVWGIISIFFVPDLFSDTESITQTTSILNEVAEEKEWYMP